MSGRQDPVDEDTDPNRRAPHTLLAHPSRRSLLGEAEGVVLKRASGGGEDPGGPTGASPVSQIPGSFPYPPPQTSPDDEAGQPHQPPHRAGLPRRRNMLRGVCVVAILLIIFSQSHLASVVRPGMPRVTISGVGGRESGLSLRQSLPKLTTLGTVIMFAVTCATLASSKFRRSAHSAVQYIPTPTLSTCSSGETWCMDSATMLVSVLARNLFSTENDYRDRRRAVTGAVVTLYLTSQIVRFASPQLYEGTTHSSSFLLLVKIVGICEVLMLQRTCCDVYLNFMQLNRKTTFLEVRKGFWMVPCICLDLLAFAPRLAINACMATAVVVRPTFYDVPALVLRLSTVTTAVEQQRHERTEHVDNLLRMSKGFIAPGTARECAKLISTRIPKYVRAYKRSGGFKENPHAGAARDRVTNRDLIKEVYNVINTQLAKENVHLGALYYEQQSRTQYENSVPGSREHVSLTDICTHGVHTRSEHASRASVYEDVLMNMTSEDRQHCLVGSGGDAPTYLVIVLEHQPNIYRNKGDNEHVVSFSGETLTSKFPDEALNHRFYYSTTPSHGAASFVVAHSHRVISVAGVPVLHTPVSSVFRQITVICPDSVKMINAYIRLADYYGEAATALNNPYRDYRLFPMLHRAWDFVTCKPTRRTQLDFASLKLADDSSNMLAEYNTSTFPYVDGPSYRMFRQDMSSLHDDETNFYQIVCYEHNGNFAFQFMASHAIVNAVLVWGTPLGKDTLAGQLCKDVAIGSQTEFHRHLGGQENIATKVQILRQYCGKLGDAPTVIPPTHTSAPAVVTVTDECPFTKRIIVLGDGFGLGATAASMSYADAAHAYLVRISLLHQDQTEEEKGLHTFELLKEFADASTEDTAKKKVKEIVQLADRCGLALATMLRQGESYYHNPGCHPKNNMPLTLATFGEVAEYFISKGSIKTELLCELATNTAPEREVMSLVPGNNQVVRTEDGMFTQREKCSSIIKNENSKGKDSRLVNNLAPANAAGAITGAQIMLATKTPLERFPAVVYGVKAKPANVSEILKNLNNMKVNRIAIVCHQTAQVGLLKQKSLPLIIKHDQQQSHSRGYLDQFLKKLFFYKQDSNSEPPVPYPFANRTVNAVRNLCGVSPTVAAGNTPPTSSVDFSKFDASQSFQTESLLTCVNNYTYGKEVGSTADAYSRLLRSVICKVRTRDRDPSVPKSFMYSGDGRNPSGSQTTTLDNNFVNLFVQFTAWTYFLLDLFKLLREDEDVNQEELDLNKMQDRISDYAMFLISEFTVVSGDDGAVAVLPFKYVLLAANELGFAAKEECKPHEETIYNGKVHGVKHFISFLCSTRVTHTLVNQGVLAMFERFETPSEDSEEPTDELCPYVDNDSGVLEVGDYAHLLRMLRSMVTTHLNPGPLPWISKAIGVFVAQCSRFGPIPGVYDMMVCYVIVYQHIRGSKDPDTVYEELLSAENSRHSKGSIAYTYREIALESRSSADALFATTLECIKSRGPCLVGTANKYGRDIRVSSDARPLIVPSGMAQPEVQEYEDLSDLDVNASNMAELTNKLILAAYKQEVTDAAIQEFLFSGDKCPIAFELENMRNDPKRPNHFYEYDRSQCEYVLTSAMSPDVLIEQGKLMDRAYEELKLATSDAKAKLTKADSSVNSQGNTHRVPGGGKKKPTPGNQKESTSGEGREEGRATPRK